MLQPIGFWSYARHDDEHSDGELSALRVQVGNELKLLYGEEITLFQDVAAIPYGADWSNKINEALDQATFFVPIVTPRFLKSEYCVEELEVFRRREEALGRKDLVFPLHYIDIEDFGANDTPFPDALKFIRSRQIFDFRALRRLDRGSKEIRLRLGEFAEGIRRTLRKRVVETKTESPAQNTQAPGPAKADADLVAALFARAFLGDAEAQLDLGHRYLWGDGVEQSDRKAAS